MNEETDNRKPEDERDQRLMLAEDLLSDLSSGYWVSVMDANDDPVKERMGQRVLNYWRKWNSPPTAARSDCAGGKREG